MIGLVSGMNAFPKTIPSGKDLPNSRKALEEHHCITQHTGLNIVETTRQAVVREMGFSYIPNIVSTILHDQRQIGQKVLIHR